MENKEGLTVGEILKKKRLEKKVSLDEAAANTNVSKKFLAALEQDRFEDLPGTIHATGFVRLYGSYLELDETFLMNALTRQLRFEQQPPLEEIMELGKQVGKSSEKKFNTMILIPIGLIVIFIVIILSMFLSKNPHNSENSSLASDSEKTFTFDKPMEWEKGKEISIPLDSQNLKLTLSQINNDLISFNNEKDKEPLLVKKNEYLRYDANNDFLFDIEIIVNDIVKDTALVTFHKIKESRLKEQKQFSVGIFSPEVKNPADLNQNQAASMNPGLDITVQVKNISGYPAFAWIVKKGRSEKEEMKQIQPGTSIDIKLLKDGVLDIDSIDFSDISAFEFKLGDNLNRFSQARGAVGFINFQMVDDNGVKKINWKANY